MRNLKLIIAILMLSATFASFGQINPINDLYYQQTYSFQNYNCPDFNCFELSWTPPDSSNDTLLGYNIYRDTELWIFTEETVIACSGAGPCGYSDFYEPVPFWITVKAVYNSDSIVSIANDSVYADLLIGMGEIKINEIALLKNPITIGENIQLFIPHSEAETFGIQLLSLDGQLIKEYEVRQVMGGAVNLSTKNMAQGLYLIRVQLNGKTINKKVMIK